MNLNLNYEGFESNLIHTRNDNCMGGIQYVFRFQNHYGASVIKHRGSYGHEDDLWELAVIEFETDDNDHWELTYDTPITADVIGWQTDEQIRELLRKIKEL